MIGKKNEKGQHSRLAIYKVQQPIGELNGQSDRLCLFYEVDPETLARVGDAWQHELDEKTFNVWFNPEEEGEPLLCRVYVVMLVYNKFNIKSIGLAYPEKWA